MTDLIPSAPGPSKVPNLGSMILRRALTTAELGRALYAPEDPQRGSGDEDDVAGSPAEDDEDGKWAHNVRQRLSSLRKALRDKDYPIPVPSGHELRLEELPAPRGQRGKRYQLRVVPHAGVSEALGKPEGASVPIISVWKPARASSYWVLEVLQALVGPVSPSGLRMIPIQFVYMGNVGTTWLRLITDKKYEETFEAAGRAVLEDAAESILADAERKSGAGKERSPKEAQQPTGRPWFTDDLLYISLGPGSGDADKKALESVFKSADQNEIPVCVRVVLIDLSSNLIEYCIANLFRTFKTRILSGQLQLLPMQADATRPELWLPLLPAVTSSTSICLSIFGNTLGHLRNDEMQILKRLMSALGGWAKDQQLALTRWNSRVFVGLSIAPRERAASLPPDEDPIARLRLYAAPLRAILETRDTRCFEMKLSPEEKASRTDADQKRSKEERGSEGRTGKPEREYLGKLMRQGTTASAVTPEEIGYFFTESEDDVRTTSGLSGQLQRYSFVFTRAEGTTLVPQEIIDHYSLQEEWNLFPQEINFENGDGISICEIFRATQDSTSRALKSLGTLIETYYAEDKDGAPYYAVYSLAPSVG